LIILAIFMVIFWLSLWKKTPSWKYLFDKTILDTPLFWEITQKIILSKFSRVFAGLIWSWVSVVESLKITSEAVWNEVYRQRILLLAEDVKWGIKIWESIDEDKLFPEMMTQMIQVWEETAKLDEVILQVADFYEEQVDNTISTLNKLLEPFIIVFLAVVVGFIAMAIMQPIMNLADTVSNS
jgi:type IV pilus assembly protein PilC